MKKQKQVIIYHYRGLIELRTPKRVSWVEGYSEQGEHGPVYPWLRRSACHADARARGATARFSHPVRGETV